MSSPGVSGNSGSESSESSGFCLFEGFCLLSSDSFGFGLSLGLSGCSGNSGFSFVPGFLEEISEMGIIISI